MSPFTLSEKEELLKIVDFSVFKLSKRSVSWLTNPNWQIVQEYYKDREHYWVSHPHLGMFFIIKDETKKSKLVYIDDEYSCNLFFTLSIFRNLIFITSNSEKNV
jgi:hypothetical protein